jgi:hypothetical protein
MQIKPKKDFKNMVKKNINKIPKSIYEKLETIANNDIVAGCAIEFKKEDIISGRLFNLGIKLDQSELQFLPSIIPPEDSGKYSNININGQEIIRKDLPIETHYNSVESPDWGDPYNGTHTVDLPYKKYPRDFKSPRELEILISCENKSPDLSGYIISFRVNEILDKNDSEFENKLFENLNILQENVGNFGIEAADVPLSEYSKSLNVSWEILPPGTLDDTIQRIFRGKNPTPQEKDTAKERYDFFQTLNPKNLVFGQSGFRRYFGALIEDNLVVFENIEYGNAVYILFDNWEDLSKLSRIDLMSGRFGSSFERVIHNSGWKDIVKKVIEDKRRV